MAPLEAPMMPSSTIEALCLWPILRSRRQILKNAMLRYKSTSKLIHLLKSAQRLNGLEVIPQVSRSLESVSQGNRWSVLRVQRAGK